MDVETVPAEAPDLPDNVVATLEGQRPRADPDDRPYRHRVRPRHRRAAAVPDRRRPRHRPRRLRRERRRVEGLYALQILHDLGFRDFGQITFLIETSEERGSPGTQALIKRLVARCRCRAEPRAGRPAGRAHRLAQGQRDLPYRRQGPRRPCRRRAAGRPQRRRRADPPDPGRRRLSQFGRGADRQPDPDERRQPREHHPRTCLGGDQRPCPRQGRFRPRPAHARGQCAARPGAGHAR